VPFQQLSEDYLQAVAQDLNSPLSIIKGYATMLKDYERRMTFAEKQDYLKAVDKATDHLGSMVSALVDVLRHDAGLLKLQLAPLDITRSVSSVVGDFRSRLPGRPIRAQLPRTCPMVNVDAGRIHGVLDCLVNNAVTYSPDGQPITVAVLPGGGEVTVSVSDLGAYIPPEQWARALEEHYRYDAQTESHPAGMALGMVFCKTVVEAHGGRIWIETDDKQAACSFTLPVSNGHTPAASI